MRALSLWQPWASLIASGEKRVETRSWGTGYRGLVAIHAAKKWTPMLRATAAGLRSRDADLPESLPRGAVVALARLWLCEAMTDELIGQQTERELDVGDWAVGRFAWHLTDVLPLSDPLPLVGRQGLFSLDEATQESIHLLTGNALLTWEVPRG